MDLGDAGALRTIPTQLGPWEATREHDWDRVAEILDTNVLLSRDYSHPNLLQPANLLVVQSGNVSSFHPAPVCYRAQGWTLASEEGEGVRVPVPNATFAREAWLSEDEPYTFDGEVGAKLLDVTKANETGGLVERRVALYVYLKSEDWRVTDSVTWVRVEMSLPPSSPAQEAEPILADLLGRALPALFVFQAAHEPTIAESLAASGAPGWAALAALVAAPVGYAAYALRPPRAPPR